MKKGNSLLLIALVIGITAAVIVVAYGIISLVLSNRSLEREKEEFDLLDDVNGFTLQRLKNELDSSSLLGKYRLVGADVTVLLKDDILDINISSNSLEYKNQIIINNNVLEMSYFYNTSLDSITLELLDMVYYLEYGYLDLISNYIKSSKLELINLENVGLEVREDKILMKLNTKLNLIDVEKEYITLDDAKNMEDSLLKDGLVNFDTRNIMAIKTGYAGSIVISVAQYNELTELAYDSLINILAVTLNYSDFYEEFIYNHSYLKLRDEETEKYKIEVEPVKQAYEQKYFGERPMIRITIFK